MNEKLEQLMKARAKTLAHHFKKAAAHHEAKATAHEKMADLHKAHADHHIEMAGHEEATDIHKKHHKASASMHKAKAAHHEKLAKLHKAYSEHNKSMAASHDGDADDATKVLKAVGLEIEEEPLNTRPITPAAPAAPAAAVEKTAATGDPAPAAPITAPTTESINDTIQKALDNKLTEAVNAAFERVLSSADFGKKVDDAIAGKLLEKLGSSTVPGEIRTFPVPRPGSQQQQPTEFGRAPMIDTSEVDPEVADLVKMEF